MKKILALILVLATGIVFAENTIIAVVNNLAISLNSVKDNFLYAKTNEDKIGIINTQIDGILQSVHLNAHHDHYSLYSPLPGRVCWAMQSRQV